MLTRSDNRTRAAALLAQAKALRSEGNANQAANVCRQALNLDPFDAAIHRHLALNLKACKRYAEAIRAAKAALAIEPDDPTLLHILDSLECRSSTRAPIGYVSRLFDRYAKTFDRRLNGDLRYRVPKILHKRLKRITRQRGRFRRTLDLGCGTGLTGAVLRPLTRHLVGVDISQQMLCRASAKSIYNAVHCADIIEYLDNAPMRFDLVVAADVFIYLGDLAPIFRLVRKRMQENGIFAFSTEQARRHPYRLRRSGRFAHHPEYIARLARHNRFATRHVSVTGIRLENNQWINGGILMFEKQSMPGASHDHADSSWRRLMALLYAKLSKSRQ